MTKVSRSQIKALAGNIPVPAAKPVKMPKGVKKTKTQAKGLGDIKFYLAAKGIKYIPEHRFHPVRQWRFDVAIPELKVAVEYEGLIITAKSATSKSGHTTISGYSDNCDKYNEAQLLGWEVLRYTVLNYKQFYNHLDILLKRANTIL